MAKRNRKPDSDDTSTTSSHNAVFVDTNLDTHLAVIVSDTDTVSDLKKKIMSEHPQCFPDSGEIKIHAIKVKRKGYFYHLADSMLVRSAFEGAKKSWFLSVDASSLKQHDDNQSSSKADASNQLALLCITKTLSGDRNNYLPGSSSKRFSLLDTSPYRNQKVPSTEQPDRGDPCNEVSKDLAMEVKHVTADPSNNLSSDAKWRSDFEMEKYDLLGEGNKLSETNTEHKDDNSKVGVSDVQWNDSPKGSLRTEPASKKRHRSKKKSEDTVSKCTVKDNSASIVASAMNASHPGNVGLEFSSGNTGKELLNDMEMANMDVGKEPSKTSFPDTNMRSDSGEIAGSQVECKNEKSMNMIGDMRCTEEASKSRSATKKKHKRERKGAGNPSEENKSLQSNFSKETSNPKSMIPENSVADKEKATTATSDCLFTKAPEDVCLVVRSGSGKKKRKKKKKLPRDQVVTAEPSSLHDVGQASFKENVEIVAKESDKASNAAIVSEQNIQHAALSGLFEGSQKQKHPEPVQEGVEGDKLPSSSIGIDVSGPDAASAIGKSDAPELGDGSGSKGTKNLKKHHSNNVKEFPPLAVNEFNNLKKDGTHSGDENIVPDDHKVETSHPDKTEEERELPQNLDPEAMQSKNCEPLSQGEADIHVKEAVVSADMLESNIATEPGKSNGIRRIKKRAKKSVATKQVISSMEHADNSASGVCSTAPRSTFNDHLSGEAKKVESILSQTERTEISKPKTLDTSFIGANGATDDMSGNEAESLPFTQAKRTQVNAEDMDGNVIKKAKRNRSSDAKTLADFPMREQANEAESVQVNQISMTQKIQENAEYMDEKSRKKTKKKPNSAAKNLPDLPIKEQEVGGEELISSNDRHRGVDTPSKTKRKTKSVKTSSKNQLTGQELELEKNSGTECGSFHPQQALRTVDLKQVPSSNTLEGNSMGRPLQYDVDGSALMDCNMTDAKYQVEVSKCDGDMVNFKDYFVPGEHEHEVAPVELVVDKVSEAKISDMEVKAKKNAEKLVVPSSATSSDLQNSLKSSVKQGSDRKSQRRNSSRESLLKDELNEVGLHSKSSKVSEKGVKAPDSHDIEQIKQPDVVNGSKTSIFVPPCQKRHSESSVATNLSLGNSEKYLQNRKETKRQSSLDRRHVTVSKASSKKLGEIVNSSPHKKSLLTTPGAIFRDGSSESSEDDNGAVNSDASTKTPSDNSSSSGYSEGESKSILKSPRNGIYGANGKDGGKSTIKSQASGPKNITMNMILRSSSRFKKAKLTATQSQLEDTESQPVDFVPDSQANL